MRVKTLITLLMLFAVCLPAFAQDDNGEATPEPVPGIIIVTEVEVTDEPVPAIIIEGEASTGTEDTEEVNADGAASAEVSSASVDTELEVTEGEDEDEGNTPELGVVTFILFGILGVTAAGLGLIGREQQYGNEETA